MRAFTLDSFDVPSALRRDIPEPHPGDTELLVRVRSSSVNPVDAFIAAGALKGMAEYAVPVTLGRDFAGVVEQIGAGVSGHSVGDEVFGFVLHANPTVRDGSWAELIAVAANNAAAKPGSVDFRDGCRRRRLLSEFARLQCYGCTRLPRTTTCLSRVGGSHCDRGP